MQPGRADGNRPAPFRSEAGVRCLVWLILLLLSGCTTARQPHRELAPVWRDYSVMPAERALAVAGELRHDRWVAGASGGHASRGAAEAEALRECARRRAQRRMQARCRLYAVGDEVVWPGP